MHLSHRGYTEQRPWFIYEVSYKCSFVTSVTGAGAGAGAVGGGWSSDYTVLSKAVVSDSRCLCVGRGDTWARHRGLQIL